MVDYLVNVPFDCVVSPSFSAFTDEPHGKGKGEKRISAGRCIIVVVNDDYDNDRSNDGAVGRRRATSIEHCLHSIEQIGSAALLVSRCHA